MQRLQVEAQHCPDRYANLYRAGENGPAPANQLRTHDKPGEAPRKPGGRGKEEKCPYESWAERNKREEPGRSQGRGIKPGSLGCLAT